MPHTTADLLDELRRLPMREGALVRVLRVLNDPESSAGAVADVLQSDPALCARLLRLVNSPAYGLAGKVKSVDRAVIALGRSTVRALALSDGAGLFCGGPDAVPRGYWEHSASVAVTASLLAGHARVSTADAMCAGLMHDLGAALLHRRDRHGYGALLDGTAAVLDTERDHYGCDHAQLTRIAFVAWGLPNDLAIAISLHHAAPASHTDRLGRLITAAEAFAFDVLGEAIEFGEPRADAGAAYDALGLLPAALEALRDQVAGEAFQLSAAFT